METFDHACHDDYVKKEGTMENVLLNTAIQALSRDEQRKGLTH